jgi:Ca2+-binding RTX toxin-like protein
VRASCFAAAAALAIVAGPATAQAASVSSVRDTLTYEAAPGESNALTLTRAPSVFRISDGGALVSAGAGCRSTGPGSVECRAADVRRVVVRLGDGDDFATTSVAGRTQVYGGAGNDRLEGGEGASDLFGEAGDDVLEGGDGDDLLDGGAGADLLSGGANAIEFLELDIALYARRTAGVRVSLDGVANDGEPGEGDNVLPDVEVVVGGAGNDVLIGSAEEVNALLGGGGNDVVRDGGGEIDLLFGERGNDLLVGGAGTDDMVGGAGNDRLLGGAGPDLLRGGAGRDTLGGGGGDDFLRGGPGRDVLAGGAGDDELEARDGERDRVVGGPGRDEAVVDRRDLVSGVEDVGAARPPPALAGRPPELAGRAAGAQRRSLFDSMSNHIAKRRS